MLPRFKDPSLLERALTHRSAVPVRGVGSSTSNERLEFLGDAVLELATTTFLFDKYLDKNEGALTAYRSALVNTQMLASVAQELGLGEKLHLSSGEEQGGGRENTNLLADTFEAVIGALYLDQGFDVVVTWLENILFTRIDVVVAEQLYKDPKSHLQELVQAEKQPPPQYRVIKTSGPDHDKRFTVSVSVNGSTLAKGTGTSKQAAQQDAAKNALKTLS